jgi:hypothetical protein
MKYGVSQLGDVKGAQAALNDQYNRQVNQARFKGLSNLISGQQIKKSMQSSAAQSKIQAMNEKLDPSVRSAYEREALAYELLGAQLPYLDPEKQADAYYRIMATIEDPRKLANELRKTQMQNDAELAKARIYAGAQGGGSGNKQLQALGDLADTIVMSNDPTAASQAKPSIIDQLSGAVSGTPAFVGNLLSPRRVSTPSPYQEQPMLPMGQGIMRANPGLFQTPDLIGGFSY